MKYILVLTLFLISGCMSDSDETKDLEKMMLELEGPAGVDNLLTSLEKFNSNAVEGLDLWISSARSTSSIAFAELTVRQNEIASEAQEALMSISNDLRFMENFNYDNASPEQLDLLDPTLVRICPNLLLNNSAIVQIKEIVSRKIILAKEPSVIKELLGGNASFFELLEKFNESQSRILISEELAYQQWCDSR